MQHLRGSDIVIVEGDNELNVELTPSTVEQILSKEVYVVGFDIPNKITSGSKFWSSLTFHLPYTPNAIYRCNLRLTYYPPGWEYASEQITIVSAKFVSIEYTEVQGWVGPFRDCLPVDKTGNYTFTSFGDLSCVSPYDYAHCELIPVQSSACKNWLAVMLGTQACRPIPAGVWQVGAYFDYYKIETPPGARVSQIAGPQYPAIFDPLASVEVIE